MKLLESTDKKVNKSKNGEKVPHLGITEVVLVHNNIINSDYQRDLRVMYIFVKKKWFGQLLNILPRKFSFLKPFNSEISYNEVWFIDRSSEALGVEDKINFFVVIN